MTSKIYLPIFYVEINSRTKNNPFMNLHFPDSLQLYISHDNTCHISPNPKHAFGNCCNLSKLQHKSSFGNKWGLRLSDIYSYHVSFSISGRLWFLPINTAAFRRQRKISGITTDKFTCGLILHQISFCLSFYLKWPWNSSLCYQS